VRTSSAGNRKQAKIKRLVSAFLCSYGNLALMVHFGTSPSAVSVGPQRILGGVKLDEG
jgi:hypothetical protein